MEEWIALLGRRDTPVDGVEDYCSFLGRALQPQNVALRQAHLAWVKNGWFATLRSLRAESATWRGRWVLLQYTTMAWSRRGFPFGALAAVSILRSRGVRCAIVFHEPFRQNGTRWIDLLRGTCQDLVIRRLYARADKAIFADPLANIPWLPEEASKAVFIPIGANIPEGRPNDASSQARNAKARTVAVFCLSDAPNRRRELEDIAHAMRFVEQKGLKARIVFVGRGTAEAKDEIEKLFDSGTVKVSNFGMQSADEVCRILSEADAMLCVRGPLYMRRGSAIAGLACGLPIIGYAGEAAGTPLEEAGVELVPYRNPEALGRALGRVLGEPSVLLELHQRSFSTQQRYFSWETIASKMVNALGRNDQQVQG
jgi:glycosyltransferase involved in cell wall biosynthesis